MLEPSGLLIGESASLRAFREELGDAARCDVPVLITGHSNCDVESVARLLHQQSRRSRAPVVAVTCSGVSDRRLESELFGEVVSGSGGAPQRQPGLAELADGGVLILTGIEELSPPMQALLFRFLETDEVPGTNTGVGPRAVDVRVIAATQGCLVERVASGQFRSDLFYRLNVIHLVVPTLPAHRDDFRRRSTIFSAPPPSDQHVELSSRRARSWRSRG